MSTRNGVKIGSIRRDMQFITVQTSNAAPLWNTGNLPVDALGNIHVNLIQNSSYQLNLSGYSPSGQTLHVAAYGEPFFTQTQPCELHFNWVRHQRFHLSTHLMGAKLSTNQKHALHSRCQAIRWLLDARSFHYFPSQRNGWTR